MKWDYGLEVLEDLEETVAEVRATVDGPEGDDQTGAHLDLDATVSEECEGVE